MRLEVDSDRGEGWSTWRETGRQEAARRRGQGQDGHERTGQCFQLGLPRRRDGIDLDWLPKRIVLRQSQGKSEFGVIQCMRRGADGLERRGRIPWRNSVVVGFIFARQVRRKDRVRDPAVGMSDIAMTVVHFRVNVDQWNHEHPRRQPSQYHGANPGHLWMSMEHGTSTVSTRGYHLTGLRSTGHPNGRADGFQRVDASHRWSTSRLLKNHFGAPEWRRGS